MTGAESLLRTLLAGGIDTCFMNPGTSEMQFVTALDRVPGMRGILCLFEGVCSGAADGYARMLGRPASTLLHLGPGLANGLANFHNARKARSPIVNIVGEHATHHMQYDAPLTADIEAIARPFSGWVGTAQTCATIGNLTRQAIEAAAGPPGQVATVIIPADYSWETSGQQGATAAPAHRPAPSGAAITNAAELLRKGSQTALLLSGSSLRADALRQAANLAAATGARVYINRYAPRVARGRGIPAHPRIPYFPEHAETLLAGLRHIVFVETSQPPVSFFGYPNRRSTVAPLDCEFHTLATEAEDGAAALDALADQLGVAPIDIASVPKPPLDLESPLTPDTIGRVLALTLPDNAILSDEMVSVSEFVAAHLPAAAPHELLPVTGGSIGQGLPVALGAAVACPDRKVVCLEADGSGMYTLQALWTMARERLDVTTVIFANRRYRILDVEIERTNSTRPGPLADAMLDLRQPHLDWVQLAQAQGVSATQATTTDAFHSQFQAAMQTPGPHLIEAIIP